MHPNSNCRLSPLCQLLLSNRQSDATLNTKGSAARTPVLAAPPRPPHRRMPGLPATASKMTNATAQHRQRRNKPDRECHGTSDPQLHLMANSKNSNTKNANAVNKYKLSNTKTRSVASPLRTYLHFASMWDLALGCLS